MRARYNAFIDRHEIAWELGMAFLAVIFVAVGFSLDERPPGLEPLLLALDYALTLVFVVEFGTRLAAAHDRVSYIRGHWIDAFALIPAVRGLRLARLVRLLRLVRAFAGVYRAIMRAERFAGARGLAWVVVAWTAITVISCAAIYAVEVGVNPEIRSPLDALWWGVETITTVGYGDIHPVTGEGRLAASILMLLGVGLFSTITAIITSSLVSARGPAGPDPIGNLERLARLHESGSLNAEEFEATKARLLARV
jgi:voltage-gated potassium channel